MGNYRSSGNFTPPIPLDQSLPGIDDILETCQSGSNVDSTNSHEHQREREGLLAIAIEEKTLKAKIDTKRRDSAGKRVLVAQWRECNYALYRALAARAGIDPESIVSRSLKTGEMVYHTEADGYVTVLAARRELYDDIARREQKARKITTSQARRESAPVQQQGSASRLGQCAIADTTNLRRWEGFDRAERASGAYLERD